MYRRKDVCDFIEELFSDTYNEKQEASINYYGSISKEQVLFTFLDALFKYQIIIDTDIFLDEYIIQVRKLFKKLDDFQDINLGISKIIGKFLALKLNIVDREDPVEKRKILEYVYNRYIVEGYFFHGFSGVYKEQIKRYGFVPEEYQHSYSKFIEVDKIFSKHRIESVMEKNFHAKYVTFTDNFMMGCFYGVNAPMYFYKLLGGGIKDKDNQANAYFNNDYLGCFNNLNRLIKKAGLNATEKNTLLRFVLMSGKYYRKVLLILILC